jgi:hypothetical protein
VDGTGSGSCPVGGFCISCAEPSGSATTVSVIVRVWFVSWFARHDVLHSLLIKSV